MSTSSQPLSQAQLDTILLKIAKKTLKIYQKACLRYPSKYFWDEFTNPRYLLGYADKEIEKYEFELSQLPPSRLSQSFHAGRSGRVDADAVMMNYIAPLWIKEGYAIKVLENQRAEQEYIIINANESQEEFQARAKALKEKYKNAPKKLESLAQSFMEYRATASDSLIPLRDGNIWQEFLNRWPKVKISDVKLESYMRKNDFLIYKRGASMNSTYGFIIKPQESKEDFKERVEKEWVKVLAQAQKNEEFQKIKKAYLEEIQKLSVQKDQVKIEDVASLLRKSPLCQTLTGIEGIKRVIERDMKELVENKFTPKEIVEALFKDGSLKVKKVPVHNLQLYLIKADQETPQAFEARFNKSWLRLKKTYFKLAVEDFAEQEQHKIPQERMGKKQIKENLQSLWDNDSVLEL